jgi:hypothetical protein
LNCADDVTIEPSVPLEPRVEVGQSMMSGEFVDQLEENASAETPDGLALTLPPQSPINRFPAVDILPAAAAQRRRRPPCRHGVLTLTRAAVTRPCLLRAPAPKTRYPPIPPRVLRRFSLRFDKIPAKGIDHDKPPTPDGYGFQQPLADQFPGGRHTDAGDPRKILDRY